MSSVRIDAEAFADIRITMLAELAGYNAYEALGRLAHLWRYCTQKGTYIVPAEFIYASLRIEPDGFIATGLGERVEQGIRVRGTEGRIEWLAERRAAARAGGVANKIRLANKPAANANEEPNGSQTGSELKPSGSQAAAKKEPNGSPLTLALTLTPTDQDQTPVVPTGDVTEINGSGYATKPKRGRPRKPKPSEPTEAERASVRVILDKLGSHNGVRYSGSDAHTALIVRHLRDGLDEMDLRYVVLHCAEELDWKNNPKLRPYLRPETLFGPQTIAKYLDAARTLRAQREAERNDGTTAYTAPEQFGDAFAEPDWMVPQ